MGRVYDEVKYIEIVAGTEIQEAVREAIKLAKRENVIVKFNFNGVELSVTQHDDVEELVDYYHRQLVSEVYVEHEYDIYEVLRPKEALLLYKTGDSICYIVNRDGRIVCDIAKLGGGNSGDKS